MVFSVNSMQKSIHLLHVLYLVFLQACHNLTFSVTLIVTLPCGVTVIVSLVSLKPEMVFLILRIKYCF